MLELRAEHLIKTYKKRTVVNDVSFNVKQGEIVGLLGPNGAGKTTSFYMIVGLIKPNAGKILPPCFILGNIGRNFNAFPFHFFRSYFN